MPDDRGHLDAEDQAKVASWLEERCGGVPQCPLCASKNWVVGRRLSDRVFYTCLTYNRASTLAGFCPNWGARATQLGRGFEVIAIRLRVLFRVSAPRIQGWYDQARFDHTRVVPACTGDFPICAAMAPL